MPVETYEGVESVKLPCQVFVAPRPANIKFRFFKDQKFWNNSVLWTVEDLQDKIVYQRHQEGEDVRGQDRRFANRTRTDVYSLTSGELNLFLETPTPTDSGIYTCSYREKGLEKSRQKVNLTVIGQHCRHVSDSLNRILSMCALLKGHK